MTKLKSNVAIKDFLKLSKKKQDELLKKQIVIYEKYDGIKLSVIYDPFISGDFMDQIIVSYKGFRIYKFENLIEKFDLQSSYGYSQFSFIWKKLEVIKNNIKRECAGKITEFFFEFIIKKPTIATEYEIYHNLIYLGSRKCSYTCSCGRVEIESDEKFFSGSFMPFMLYPYCFQRKKVFKDLDSLLLYVYSRGSEFGGEAEGAILLINGEYYKIVNPEKRTKEYRIKKTKKYFFVNQRLQQKYDADVIGAAEQCLDYYFFESPKSSFEAVLQQIFNACYFDFSDADYNVATHYCINKTSLNIKDDIYVKARKMLIDKWNSSKTPVEKKIEPKLVIIRGLPGSGKTTIAQSMYGDGSEYVVHFEADMFFVKDDGKYSFNKEFAKYAHEWCFSNMVKSILNGYRVIISNTFTTWDEIYPYLKFSVDNGVECCIIEATGEYNNIHDVPEDVLVKMKERWISTDLIQQMFDILKQRRSK